VVRLARRVVRLGGVGGWSVAWLYVGIYGRFIIVHLRFQPITLCIEHHAIHCNPVDTVQPPWPISPSPHMPTFRPLLPPPQNCMPQPPPTNLRVFPCTHKIDSANIINNNHPTKNKQKTDKAQESNQNHHQLNPFTNLSNCSSSLPRAISPSPPSPSPSPSPSPPNRPGTRAPAPTTRCEQNRRSPSIRLSVACCPSLIHPQTPCTE
jgi:hypothetical protein